MPRLAITDAGEGPVVLLIHGFLFNRQMWADTSRALTSAGFRTVAVDLPGFGGSSSPGREAITLDDQVESVVATLESLHVHSATVVGYSMGGQVALRLAERNPGLVNALALVDTTCAADAPQQRENRLRLAERLEQEGVQDYADEFLPLVLSQRAVDEKSPAVTTALEMMRSADPSSAAATLRGRAARPDLSSAAAALSIPAMVVVGAEDAFDTQGLGARLADLIPGATLEVIDQAGHTPSLERPQEFNRVLLQFLSQSSPNPSVPNQSVPNQGDADNSPRAAHTPDR